MMRNQKLQALVAFAAVLSSAFARTDLSGCTSTDVSSPAGASLAWYVPGTGEICAFLDCGGGTAPPKTTVPGCPLYSGTATYSPSYLPGFGAAVTTSFAAASSSTSAAASASAGDSDTWSSSAIVMATSSFDSYLTSGTSEATAQPASGDTFTSTPSGGPLSSPASSIAMVPSTSAATTTSRSVSASSGTVVTSGGSSTTSSVQTTSSTNSQSTVRSDGGAMETARAWTGGAGLVGLGALVAML